MPCQWPLPFLGPNGLSTPLRWQTNLNSPPTKPRTTALTIDYSTISSASRAHSKAPLSIPFPKPRATQPTSSCSSPSNSTTTPCSPSMLSHRHPLPLNLSASNQMIGCAITSAIFAITSSHHGSPVSVHFAFAWPSTNTWLLPTRSRRLRLPQTQYHLTTWLRLIGGMMTFLRPVASLEFAQDVKGMCEALDLKG